ncbi:MAG: ATP synthase F1 subunit gamma [Actinomycetota bacterium]
MGAKVRAIRRRSKAVTTTQQITRAMELIAASRIVRAQARALRARPFAKAIGEMIEMLTGEVQESPLLAEREVRKVGLVVITSDRGLAGAYNSNVLREAERARRRESEAGAEVEVSAIGRKGLQSFRFRRIPLVSEFTGMSDQPRYAQARQIAEGVIERYIAGDIDKILLAYTDFVSMALQRARVAQILPAPRQERDRAEEGPRAVFEFEPEPSALLDALLPRYVELKIFAAMLESAASEHAARRRAMKDATDSATDLLKILRRDENRARQAEITSEIADLVGASEALQ